MTTQELTESVNQKKEKMKTLRVILTRLSLGDKIEGFERLTVQRQMELLASEIYILERQIEDNRKAYLEFTYRDKTSEDGRYNMVVDYELVIPLCVLDGRNNKEDGMVNDVPGWKRVLLGQTKVGCRSPILDGKVGTPFRDGAHAIWDSMAMNGLEIYSRYGEARTLVKAANEIGMRD